MTRHDDLVRLRHMLDHAREAVDLARDRQREDLDNDRMFRYALTHLVEIGGEAAARVSEHGIQSNPHVPLRQARGMRNRLIHGYDAVDLDVLWATIQEDIPAIIKSLEAVEGLPE